MIQCLHDDLLELTRGKIKVYDVWTALKDAFSRKSIAKQIYLMQELFGMKLRADEALQSFFVRFDKKIRELKEIGEKLEEVDIVIRLMMLMPETYRPVISALETLDRNDVTVTQVKSRLLEEELRINKTSSEELFEHPTAMHAAQSRKTTPYKKKKDQFCFVCGDPNHIAPNCPDRKTSSSEKDVETVTGNLATISCSKAYAMTAKETSNCTNNDWFILDSGCSRHMVNDLNLLTDIKKLEIPVKISVAKDGEEMFGDRGGILNCKNQGGEYLRLKNVVYVPKCSYNLISVNSLLTQGYQVTFDDECAKIMRNGTVVGNAVVVKGMYRLDLTAFVKHPNLVNSCNFTVKKIENRPLATVYSSIAGPITPDAVNGERYFVSFVDEFTQMKVIYLMKHKNELADKFKEFVDMATKQFRTNIGQFKSGYENDQIGNYCIQNGTHQEYVTDSQNVAVKLNQDLCEKAKLMIGTAKVDKALWGEAVNFALYIENRTPNVNSGISSYEAWFKIKPDTSNLHAFGCNAFVKMTNFREREFKFLGYGIGCYRLWNQLESKMAFAKNVEFDDRKLLLPGSWDGFVYIEFPAETEIDGNLLLIDDESDTNATQEIVDTKALTYEKQVLPEPRRGKRKRQPPKQLNDGNWILTTPRNGGRKKKKNSNSSKKPVAENNSKAPIVLTNRFSKLSFD